MPGGNDGAGEARTRIDPSCHTGTRCWKARIADAVLLKPGRLDANERVEMERHSSLGGGILSGSGDELLQSAALLARCHHERYDGKGYPQGLAGDAIPLAVRIVAVADAFDAMTEDRCYRPSMSEETACGILERESGTHFDAEVVSVFVEGFARIRSARRQADRLLRSNMPAEVVTRSTSCIGNGYSCCGSMKIALLAPAKRASQVAFRHRWYLPVGRAIYWRLVCKALCGWDD
ncbi:HD-GYP domain-containing protein [Cupriavidus basilensis]